MGADPDCWGAVKVNDVMLHLFSTAHRIDWACGSCGLLVLVPPGQVLRTFASVPIPPVLVMTSLVWAEYTSTRGGG